MRAILLILILAYSTVQSLAQSIDMPSRLVPVLGALKQERWTKLEDGLEVLKAITPSGLVVTAYRISPELFEFSVVTQTADTGSRAREIGEREGAVLVTNAGFFAVNGNGRLYSIGYLRLGDTVLSKGWSDAGGTITFRDSGPELKPTHAGIPQNEFDVLQSRPMLIEPGGTWAMGSNSGASKFRTMLCTLSNKSVILTTVTRIGLTLFEAGWMMRSPQQGGFFGCDAAIALDGGRSTQIWHSGEAQFSVSGFTPVHNFLVIRQREER